MAVDLSKTPNPGINRDLVAFKTAFANFLSAAKDQSKAVNAADSVAVGTFKNWLEENFERYLGEFDLNFLVTHSGFLGLLGGLLHSVADMNSQLRLILFSYLAAYVDRSNIGGEMFSNVVSSLFNALPQALPLMFNNPNPKLDHIEKELNKVAKTTGYASMLPLKYWKLSGELDPIHKSGADWHSIPADAKDVNEGAPYSMYERFPYGPWCPSCFRSELKAGLIKIEKVEKLPAPKKGRAFAFLADFENENKRELIETLLMAVRSEMKDDPGLGLAGDSNHLWGAFILGFDSKENAKAVEKFTPDDRQLIDELYQLSEMSREQIEKEKFERGTNTLLPRKIRVFVERLLLAYGVEHPITYTEARTKDWGDRLIDKWVPASLKPKKQGLAGLWEMWGKPLGALFLLLTAILLILALILLIGLTAAVVTFLCQVLGYVIGAISGGTVELTNLFQPHMLAGMLTILKAVVISWLILVLLPVIGTVRPSFESVRGRVQTLRIVIIGVGLGATIIGLATGQFLTVGVGGFLVAVFTIILMVEFGNKNLHRMRLDFLHKSTEQFVTYGSAVGVTLLVLVCLYMTAIGAQPNGQNATRAAALVTGVTNRTEDLIAKHTNVDLPLTAAQCEKGKEALAQIAQGKGIDSTELCKQSPFREDPVCSCKQ